MTAVPAVGEVAVIAHCQVFFFPFAQCLCPVSFLQAILSLDRYLKGEVKEDQLRRHKMFLLRSGPCRRRSQHHVRQANCQGMRVDLVWQSGS